MKLWMRAKTIFVCLDISHSKLVCNTYDVDFQNFLTKVAPFTKHIHVGDARGEMEKDFKSVMVRLILERRENF